jgi:ribosomal protein S18 acetylase RimI-like enzyme
MIRWLSADDLLQWRDIRAESLCLHPTAFLTTIEEFRAESDASVARKLSQGNVLGAFQGDELLCVAAYRRRTAKRLTLHRAEITAVYARPAAQGTGLAAQLMRQLETHARDQGVTQLELDVEAANIVALKFYQRLGYQQYGILPNGVIRDGVGYDDLFMVRLLDR